MANKRNAFSFNQQDLNCCSMGPKSSLLPSQPVNVSQDNFVRLFVNYAKKLKVL
jgi:hypothetical protein